MFILKLFGHNKTKKLCLFKETGSVANKKRTNEHNFLINSLGALKINELIHRNPEITVKEIKRKLNLIADENTINSYVVKLGWTRKKNAFRSCC